MRFFSQLIAFAAAAATVSANTMKWVNLDGNTRTLYFTASAGLEEIEPLTIEGYQEATTSFPQGWIGNVFSVTEGNPVVTGMLAELTFQGWMGYTYFDVSAIVNPLDHEGVHLMYPASVAETENKTPYSGCEEFPCNTAYYAPNDVQTVVTEEVDLITTLGSKPNVTTRDVEMQLVARKYVEGKL
ncbi:DNase1 protein [Xylariaceae sp. FL0255]|nr:DNase1 protein [Xylariaceae sp. FL0255]